VFEQIKDLEFAYEEWKTLEGSYEGTPAIKETQLYILKDKLTRFNLQEGESILKMFHSLNVNINKLTNLGKVSDEDFYHWFFRCSHKGLTH
jgi:hypothetical protein